MFGKRYRKYRILLYAVYLLLLLAAILLLYMLIPAEVWNVMRQAYVDGEVEL